MDDMQNSSITERHLERAGKLGAQRAGQRIKHDKVLRQTRPRESLEEILDDLDPNDLWFAVKGDKFPTTPTELDIWSLELLTDAFLDAYDEEYDAN